MAESPPSGKCVDERAEVLDSVQSIPANSAWLLVCKIDRRELFQGWACRQD